MQHELQTRARGDVNILLLQKNMTVIRDILDGKDVLGENDGKTWSMDYVLIEQSYVKKYLKKNPLSESAASEINGNFKRFEGLHPEFKAARENLGVASLDFRKYDHRVAIGRALVDMKYGGSGKGTMPSRTGAKTKSTNSTKMYKNGKYDTGNKSRNRTK